MAATNTAVAEPQFDAVDWDALAWLMHIPGEGRQNFISYLQGHIEFEWSRLDEDPNSPFRRWRAAKPLVKRSRRADAEIARTGRAFIQAIEQRGALSTPTEREIVKAIRQYLDETVTAPKRGAPMRWNRFASFLNQLFTIVHFLGGRVTFNRKRARGNIVDLIDELRPLLPPGFVLKALPMSLIERLATKARARA